MGYICGEESNRAFFRFVVERGTRGNKYLRLDFAWRKREREREVEKQGTVGVGAYLYVEDILMKFLDSSLADGDSHKVA